MQSRSHGVELANMAKSKPFTLNCPCCQAELTVDPEIQSIITFKAAEKPREIEDIETAMQMFKGEANRREDAFQKSVQAEKNKANVLDRKFDELLKRAKESPAEERPKGGIEWD
jgi:hypothetical protein